MSDLPFGASLDEIVGRVLANDLDREREKFEKAKAANEQLRRVQEAQAGVKLYTTSELVAKITEDAADKAAQGLEVPKEEAKDVAKDTKPEGRFPPPPIKHI